MKKKRKGWATCYRQNQKIFRLPPPPRKYTGWGDNSTYFCPECGKIWMNAVECWFYHWKNGLKHSYRVSEGFEHRYEEFLWRRENLFKQFLKKVEKFLHHATLSDFMHLYDTNYFFFKNFFEMRGYVYQKYDIVKRGFSNYKPKKIGEKVCHYGKCRIKKDLVPIEKAHSSGKSYFRTYLCQKHFKKWVKIINDSYFFLKIPYHTERDKFIEGRWEKLWKAFVEGRLRKRKKLFIKKRHIIRKKLKTGSENKGIQWNTLKEFIG